MAEQLYYVKDSRSCVGNCILWWGKDRNGYACNLDRAGLYTAAEVASMRETDHAYPRELVEECTTPMVDHQILEHHADYADPIVGGRPMARSAE